MRRAGVLLLLAGCAPEIVDTTALVTSPRILAVEVTPAEVRPGQAFTLRALDAGPNGAAGRALAWALCTERTPLTEPGPLASACLGVEGPALTALGTGDAVMGTVPREVCRNFGPDQPAPKPGQPPGRPADPDGTGGYYQPVRIRAPGANDTAFGVRVLCNLGSASPAQQSDFDRGYHLNQAPALAGLFRADGARLTSLEEDPAAAAAVPAGAPLGLRATWAQCPPPAADDTKGCPGSESYLWLDPAARNLTPRREELRVSWYATAGTFEAARTGRSEEEAPTASDSGNVWTAPASAGQVLVWLVIRDDRGGLSWSSYRLTVR